ncbi:MAG TPA: response regulator [Candidatus Thermoplasmatota archaeon]|nr:response regulator [Candidatus Thermoplasmatota archaeon]
MTMTTDPDQGKRTILVVDDEPDILFSIKLLLERSPKGLQVVTAASGVEGLDVLRSRDIDLIVSDFKMPGMDGIEFLLQAHQLKPDVPRVMFTAYADAELARRAVAEAFVQGFLAKTMPPRELVQRVEAILGD